MKHNPKLIGDKVYLSPIGTSDGEVTAFTRWLNDATLTIQLDIFTWHLDRGQERAALQRLSEEGNVFAIYAREEDVLIGSCALEDINWINGTAECGILIGDAERRGKGYGSDAMRLLLDWAFNGLNLRNVWLKAYSFNKYERLGFQTVGHRRQSRTVAGKHYDTVYMDILATDFKSPYIKDLLPDDA